MKSALHGDQFSSSAGQVPTPSSCSTAALPAALKRYLIVYNLLTFLLDNIILKYS